MPSLGVNGYLPPFLLSSCHSVQRITEDLTLAVLGHHDTCDRSRQYGRRRVGILSLAISCRRNHRGRGVLPTLINALASARTLPQGR